MKDDELKTIMSVILESSKHDEWDFKSEDHAALYYCEMMIKVAAGYALSHTEYSFLRIANSALKLIRKDGRTPTKKGFMLLCNVYYASSNRKSKGCIWANKYKQD